MRHFVDGFGALLCYSTAFDRWKTAMDKAPGAQAIGKRTAYALQAAFLLLGFALQNLTFADRDIALLASSIGLIVQIGAILWFCKTRRGYVGRPLLTGAALVAVAVIVGTGCIYEGRAGQHSRTEGGGIGVVSTPPRS
jgi:hypothetical protein